MSPLVAGAATVTKPTPGNLSISINGELKHQEGSAIARSTDVDSSALAVGADARAITTGGNGKVETNGDRANVVVAGYGSSARAVGSVASIEMGGNFNQFAMAGDHNSVGVNSVGLHLTIKGNSNQVSITGYDRREFNWVINNRHICYGSGCSSSGSAALRVGLGAPVAVVGGGPLFGLFGNGVDAANGGTGGTAGLFGNGGLGAATTTSGTKGNNGQKPSADPDPSRSVPVKTPSTAVPVPSCRVHRGSMPFLDILPSMRNATTPRLDPAVWSHTTHVDNAGRLTIGGVACADIADECGTPAFVLDEADFRRRARRYRKELPGTNVVYAGKALLTTGVARWAAEEHLGVDVCSGAELAIALAGNVPPARIVYHGTFFGAAKTYDELAAAVDAGVGRIVVDSLREITDLGGLARTPQNVLVRCDPDAEDNREVTARIMAEPTLRLVGLHCHLGSQVCDPGQYAEAVARMIVAMADVRRAHRVVLGELNIGGGHGVPCVSGDPELKLCELASCIDDALDHACAAERFPRPTIAVEPGRGLCARAGVTLHRVQSVQSLPTGRTVAVDGAALNGARYTATLANRRSLGPSDVMTVGLSGAEMELPADIHPGDLIALACTGAYQLNGPPLVAVCDGKLFNVDSASTEPSARDRG